MGGFSDNYECGYWDEAEPISRKNKKTTTQDINKKILYKIESDLEYQYLYILLTPLHLLTPHQKDNRITLTKTCSNQTSLEVNEKITQNKTIEIYYEDSSIGNILKISENNNINYSHIVNDFCFIDDKLKEIEAFWDGFNFYIRRKL